MTETAPKPNEYSDEDYRYILEKIGASASPQNLSWMKAWRAAEGGTASNNPFNTTQFVRGATRGSGSVQSYRTRQQGLDATIDTLLYAGGKDKPNQGYYRGVTAALRTNNPYGATEALVRSPWAEGKYGGGQDWKKSSVYSAYERRAPKIEHDERPTTPTPSRQFVSPPKSDSKSGWTPSKAGPDWLPDEINYSLAGMKGALSFGANVVGNVARQATNVAMGNRGVDVGNKKVYGYEPGSSAFDWQPQTTPRSGGQQTSDIAWTAAAVVPSSWVAKPLGFVARPIGKAASKAAAAVGKAAGDVLDSRFQKFSGAFSSVKGGAPVPTAEDIVNSARSRGPITRGKNAIGKAGAGLAMVTQLMGSPAISASLADIGRGTASISRTIDDISTAAKPRQFTPPKAAEAAPAAKVAPKTAEVAPKTAEAAPAARAAAEAPTTAKAPAEASTTRGAAAVVQQALAEMPTVAEAPTTAHNQAASTSTSAGTQPRMPGRLPPAEPRPGDEGQPRRLKDIPGADINFGGQSQFYSAVY